MSKITDPALLKQLNEEAPAGDPARAPPRVEGGYKLGNEIDLMAGVAQGVIDPIEGIVQLAEKSSGWHLAPEGVKNMARALRNRAQSSALGIGGEVAGNLLPMIIAPEAEAAGWLGRAAAGAARAGMQPVSGGKDNDYWATKGAQLAGGAAAGPAGAALARGAGKVAPYLPFVGHPLTGIAHLVRSAMGKHSNPPISQLANAASRLPSAGYAATAGMARGAVPIKGDQQAPEPSKDEDTTPPPPPAKPAPPPAVAGPDFRSRFSAVEDQ